MDSTHNREILELAEKIMTGNIDRVVGIRELHKLYCSRISENNDIALLLTAIEDEMEQFPVGEMRGHYDKLYLEKLDSELKIYLDSNDKEILTLCKKIISTLHRS